MDLTGKRATLILNICALVLALIISAEVTYITYYVYGRLPHWSDWVAGFVPVLVMFIIRSWGFSYIFTFLHFGIAIKYFFVSRSVYFGLLSGIGSKLPFFPLILLFLLSLVCLVAYGSMVLIKAALARLNKRRPATLSD